MIGDNKVDPLSYLPRKVLNLPITIAVSTTGRQLHAYKPGFSFELRKLIANNAIYAATASFDAYICSDDETFVAGAIGIDAAAEKYLVALSRYRIGGRQVEKAAVTAQTFTANHPVTASKFGIILIQVSNTGVYSTKIPGATQTTAMAYNSAALALAALPAADAGKRAVGCIKIAAKAALWTANTDDMTNGSDLTTATFVTNAVSVTSALTTPLVPVTGEIAVATLSATRANVRGGRTDTLVLTYTTDGGGALTNGVLSAEITARPLAGQVRSE